MNGCSSCGVAGYGGGTLNGLVIAGIDLGNISIEALSESLSKLGEEDLTKVLLGLPEDVVRKVCKAGVEQEANSIMPWVLAGAAGLVLFMIFK